MVAALWGGGTWREAEEALLSWVELSRIAKTGRDLLRGGGARKETVILSSGRGGSGKRAVGKNTLVFRKSSLSSPPFLSLGEVNGERPPYAGRLSGPSKGREKIP